MPQPTHWLLSGSTTHGSVGTSGRRIDQESAWWWHRRPSLGPLGDYLAIEWNALICRNPLGRAEVRAPQSREVPWGVTR